MSEALANIDRRHYYFGRELWPVTLEVIKDNESVVAQCSQ